MNSLDCLTPEMLVQRLKVFGKLQKARLALQGKKLNKTGHNKFAGYYYFELGDFLPTVQEIFAELGLCGVVSFTPDMAYLEVIDTEGGGMITFTSPMSTASLKGCHEVQNVGAVETYQRRYLWVTAMEIVEHDALDATTAADQPKSSKSVPKSAFDSMDREMQKWLENVAMDVKKALHQDKVKQAFERIEKEHMEADEKAGLWSLLDSKERSALKKYGESLRQPANPTLEKVAAIDTSQLDALLDKAADIAGRSLPELEAFFAGLTPAERQAIGAIRMEEFKTIASFNEA